MKSSTTDNGNNNNIDLGYITEPLHKYAPDLTNPHVTISEKTMADTSHLTDGPSPRSVEGYDSSLLPDFDREFIAEEHLKAFERALSAPDPSPSTDDLLATNGLTSPGGLPSGSQTSLNSSKSRDIRGGSLRSASQSSLFITAQNDWAPVNKKIRSSHKRKSSGVEKEGKKRRKSSRPPRRSKDETREGYLYNLLKWPLLGIVLTWVASLAIGYLFTRLYIWLYEHFVAVSNISEEYSLIRFCSLVETLSFGK